MTDKGPKLDPSIRNEQHKLYSDGGYSKVIIDYEFGHDNTFTCEITQIDKEKCNGDLYLHFKDPVLAVDIFGTPPKSVKNPTPGGETLVCSVSYSAGPPHIKVLGTEPLKLPEDPVTYMDPKTGVYNGSLYVDLSHRQNHNLTCLVEDGIGAYKKSVLTSKAVFCPADDMQIDQPEPVQRTDGILRLRCKFRGQMKDFQGMYWEYGSHRQLLHKYPNDTNRKIAPGSNISTIQDGDEMSSNFRMNISEFHDSAIVCVSIWKGGDSCIARHNILFASSEPLAGELNEAASNIWWTNILIAVIGVLLIAGVLAIVITYYKRRMKRAAAVKQCEEVELYELLPSPQETIRRYKDDKFPATRQSLIGQSGIIELLQNAEKDVFSIEWRRPWKICLEMENQMSANTPKKPCMFSSGDVELKVEDIYQGYLRDGWLLASLGAVIASKRFHDKIRIQPEPDLTKKGPGQICFQLYVFGEWKYIWLDDRLPTIRNELIFAHCRDPCVFWVALVEKAFAKLYGSYKNLEGIGLEVDVMVDLTGGIVVYFKTKSGMDDPENIKQHREELWNKMSNAYENDYPMTCATAVCLERKKKGIPVGAGNRHCFMISGFAKAADPSSCRIQLRDTSIHHKKDDQCQCLVNLKYASSDACATVIEYDKFVEIFEQVDICYIPINADKNALESNGDDHSRAHAARGLRRYPLTGIIPAVSDGYTDDIVESVPQFKIKCTTDVSPGGRLNKKDGLTRRGPDGLELFIGVLQKNAPPRSSAARKFRSLKICVYKVKENYSEQDEAYTKSQLGTELERIAKFANLKRHREQGGRVTIYGGKSYVIIIRREFADVEIEYLLRIFADISFEIYIKKLKKREDVVPDQSGPS